MKAIFCVYELKDDGNDVFLGGFPSKQSAEEFINESDYSRLNYYWLKVLPGGFEPNKHFSSLKK